MTKLKSFLFGLFALALGASSANAACYQWSTNAASNGSADPSINWAEGMAPSSVNDSARAMMARLQECRADVSGSLTTGGTSTSYTLTTNQGYDTLAHLDGQKLCFKLNVANGTPALLNVDSLGAKPFRSAPSVELNASVIPAGAPVCATYVNATTEFILEDFYVQTVANNSITTAMLQNGAVTYAKIQNLSGTNKLLGRHTAGAGSVEEFDIGTGFSVAGSTLNSIPVFPRGYLDGGILSNNGTNPTTAIDVGAAAARNDGNTANITLASALTNKQLDANWVVGSAHGMRDSSAGITNTTYHIWLVTDGTTTDVYATTQTTESGALTALHLEPGGSAYNAARRIGSIIRKSAAIVAFLQVDDFFYTATAADSTSISASPTLITYTVPTGIVVRPLLSVTLQQSAGGDSALSLAPGANSALSYAFIRTNLANMATAAEVLGPPSNTSGQVFIWASSNTGGIAAYSSGAHGWLDPRGKQ